MKTLFVDSLLKQNEENRKKHNKIGQKILIVNYISSTVNAKSYTNIYYIFQNEKKYEKNFVPIFSPLLSRVYKARETGQSFYILSFFFLKVITSTLLYTHGVWGLS